MVLSEEQKIELTRVAQSRSLPAGYVFRARLMLMLAEGASYSSIKQQLSRWKQRFLIESTSTSPTKVAKPSFVTVRW